MKRRLLLLAAVVAGLALGLVGAYPLLYRPGTPPVYKVEAAANFRIVDVRAEYGHLVVEVEHFKSDGTFWFFENYLFQGREGAKHPKETNALGDMFLDDGTVAPIRLKVKGATDKRVGRKLNPDVEEYYVPEGRDWKYSADIYLGSDSVLGVVGGIHQQRVLSGWNKGRNRLTVAPRSSRKSDQDNVQVLVDKLRPMVGTAYYRPPPGALLAYVGWLPRVNPGQGALEWGTVSTFYPDADPETTSVDGGADRSRANADAETFSTIRTSAGLGAQSADPVMIVRLKTAQFAGDSPKYVELLRTFQLFDTSSIPDGDTIDSATFELVAVPTAFQNGFSPAASASLITTTPASNTNLVTGDYLQTGTTKQAPDLTFASLVTDSSTYNVWTLDATGRGNVSKTGISKFGVGTAYDVENSAPTWVENTAAQVRFASAEEDLAGDKRPKLVVTHSTPATAAITGTMTPSGTEQEVRTGGETIIITLTGVTWNAAGSGFDNQRQAIINGVTSAQSETRGWNNLVRGTIPVTDVVRTSSTAVTITLSASAGYSVTANDVITVTVPGAAHSGGSAITATPTFFVAAGLETLTIGGTLTSSGTPLMVRTGGNTITYTVSGASVSAAGSAFDGARQGVLDNIDSAQADQNGWDALRSLLPVTNVVRTSGSVITVTLSALSAYAIPALETITATLPASGALVFPGILTGTPTFNITPSFVASGNRVSPAINLSSIAAVAYCAIGWEATTPASTTVTVETSVNNGTTYSSATNGSCPTGISMGANLASITQFRIRANLSTTASGSTPTLDALVLIVVDRTGHALHYELNTTPGITIEDRSDNTNDGTLSFPVPSAVITSTTGDITTTRDAVSNQVLSPIDVTSPVTGAANQGNLFQQAEEGFSDLPFYDLIRAMASAGDTLPIRFVWTVFLGMMILLLGVVVLHLTTSLFAAVVAMGLGIVIVGTIGNGLIPTWIIFPYIAIAGGLMLLRPRMQT